MPSTGNGNKIRIFVKMLCFLQIALIFMTITEGV